MATDAETPVACTLTGSSYQERLDWIARLNRDGLRSHERRGLVLELRYASEMRERVREMVRNEEECCAFLRFELAETTDDIGLVIIVPERAQDVADLFFEQFVPSASP